VGVKVDKVPKSANRRRSKRLLTLLDKRADARHVKRAPERCAATMLNPRGHL
jgi:hypothetical protein